MDPIEKVRTQQKIKKLKILQEDFCSKYLTKKSPEQLSEQFLDSLNNNNKLNKALSLITSVFKKDPWMLEHTTDYLLLSEFGLKICVASMKNNGRIFQYWPVNLHTPEFYTRIKMHYKDKIEFSQYSIAFNHFNRNNTSFDLPLDQYCKNFIANHLALNKGYNLIVKSPVVATNSFFQKQQYHLDMNSDFQVFLNMSSIEEHSGLEKIFNIRDILRICISYFDKKDIVKIRSLNQTFNKEINILDLTKITHNIVTTIEYKKKSIYESKIIIKSPEELEETNNNIEMTKPNKAWLVSAEIIWKKDIFSNSGSRSLVLYNNYTQDSYMNNITTDNQESISSSLADYNDNQI